MDRDKHARRRWAHNSLLEKIRRIYGCCSCAAARSCKKELLKASSVLGNNMASEEYTIHPLSAQERVLGLINFDL